MAPPPPCHAIGRLPNAAGASSEAEEAEFTRWPPLCQAATHAQLASPLGHTIYEAALPCSVAAAARALFSNGASFTATLSRRQGGAAGRDGEVSIDAWRRARRRDGGGLVRGVRWATDVRSKLSPVQRTRVVEEQSCATLEGGDVVRTSSEAPL